MRIIFFYFIIIFALISHNCEGQIESINVDKAQIPTSYWRIYYADSVPKILDGYPYNGIDSAKFIFGGENLLAVATYKDGYKVDLRTYYDNGQIERHYQFEKGKRNGVSKGWYKTGKIMFDDLMQNGKHVGIKVDYYENGGIQYITDFNSFSIGFFENGKVSSKVSYLKDTSICHGSNGYEEVRYYSTGQMESKIIANCGWQRFTYFYNDSLKKAEGVMTGFTTLSRVGDYTQWFSNGKKELEAHYSVNKPDVKVGNWRYWNEKGQLTKEEFYENNELKKTKIHIPEKKKLIKAQ